MIQKISTKWAYALIILCIFFALSPVLFASYIRQDDMAFQLPANFSLTSHYNYYNAVFQLVRPISFLIFFTTDKISFNLDNSVYVRLVSVFLIMTIGLLVYNWQEKFYKNQVFSFCFAIAFCTLPAFQIYAATANYLHMIFTTFLSVAAIFLIHDQLFSKKFFAGCFLYFLGLLDYPLASMIVWPLLLIPFLQTKKASELKPLIFTGITFIGLMGFYFIFIQIFHWFFAVDLSTGRAAIVKINLLEQLNILLKVYSWHSNLWFWHDVKFNFFPLATVAIFFLFALNKSLIKDDKELLYLKFLGVVGLAALAYLPALIATDFNVNFRYSLATMPLLLYIIFWSLDKIADKTRNLAFICIALIGIFSSFLHLQKDVVKPQVEVLNSIKEQLKTSFNPQEKTYIIANWQEGDHCYEYNAPGFEYNMRITQYSDQVMSAIVHSLRRLGFYYDLSDKKIQRETDKISVETPFGKIIVLRKPLTISRSMIPRNTKIIFLNLI